MAEVSIPAELESGQAKAWQEQNREAIEAWSAWVAEHGLPFEEHRQF